MQKREKKKTKPIHWMIAAEVIVLLVGLILGFKITYAPYLENDWEAISAVASWVSVFVSGLAIYYAIQVPKRIAEEQNRIALFEKRFEVYKVLMDCFAFAYMLKKIDIPDYKCREIFHITFNDEAKLDTKATYIEEIRTYSVVQNKLKMAEHLFGIEIGEKVALLLATLLLLIQTEQKHGKGKKLQQNFIQRCKDVEKECTPKIKDLLSLKQADM